MYSCTWISSDEAEGVTLECLETSAPRTAAKVRV